MTNGWMDWRDHSVGPARPCRICTGPAICRDEHGRPCHKVCAERCSKVTTEGLNALILDFVGQLR